MLLYRQTIRNYWKALNEDQREATVESTQRIFKAMKKKLKPKNQLKAELQNNFKENSTKVNN